MGKKTADLGWQKLWRRPLQQKPIRDEVKDCLRDSAVGLSVAWKQRLVARIAKEISPKIILLDEPTSSLP